MTASRAKIITGFDLQLIAEFRAKKSFVGNKSIFTEAEIAYCAMKHDPQQTYAGIFACKEAVIKALSAFQSRPSFGFNDIELHYDINGRPSLKFHRELREFIINQSLDYDLSISHSGGMAGATVVLLYGGDYG